jgi:hypothetical protein
MVLETRLGPGVLSPGACLHPYSRIPVPLPVLMSASSLPVLVVVWFGL